MANSIANYNSPNLLVVMDCLWFQQAFLFSEPISSLAPKITTNTTTPLALDLSSLPSFSEEETSPATSSPSPPKNIHDGHANTTQNDEDDEDEDDDLDNKQNEDLHHHHNHHMQIPTTRQTLTTRKKKWRSHSSSPSLHKLPKHLRPTNTLALQKTMSMTELEHEELKGFMDLGFTFKKEELSPRMMSVLPGLQRLEEYENDDDIEEYRRPREEGVMRPYLSEAWLIRRANSPLVNVRMPRMLLSKKDDMKKHLRDWARSVASAIQYDQC